MVDDRCQSLQGTPPCSERKRGLNTKVHLAVDAHGMPVRVVITQGTTADCKCASTLIEGIDAEYLLADRGYDTDDIIEQAKKQGMTPVIPPKKTEKYRERTTEVFIASDIWLRTLFYTSSAYEVSQLGMQKIQPLF